ncbi:MAG: hypothetical protein ACKV2Q_11830, partial [Planctomycetaceae bacterium]
MYGKSQFQSKTCFLTLAAAGARRGLRVVVVRLKAVLEVKRKFIIYQEAKDGTPSEQCFAG